jgi:hypothetical protein
MFAYSLNCEGCRVVIRAPPNFVVVSCDRNKERRLNLSPLMVRVLAQGIRHAQT